MQEGLAVLDSLRLNFSPGGLVILNITIGFIMFGVALEMRIKKFKKVLLHPKPVIVGVISQFFLLPLLTFLVVIILRPTPAVALGMILVASCPGGNVSNFISSLAKGNIELSVSLTAIATLAAIFMTPVNFALYGGWYVDIYNNMNAGQLLRPIEIEFWQIFQTVFILLGIPVILGPFVHYKFPRTTYKSIKYIKTGSVILFAGIVVAMLANNFEFFIKYIHLVILIVLFHNALAFMAGWSLSSVTKLSPPDKRSITIETGIQNSGLALALLFNPKIFPADLNLGGMAFIAAWWGIWHIVAGLSLAGILNLMKHGKSTRVETEEAKS
jgi:bile acid:Na+ symporter, BASS family